jgi:hypothetical protein
LDFAALQELKPKSLKSRELSVDFKKSNCDQKVNRGRGKEHMTSQLQNSLRELRSQNEVLVEELKYAQSSLADQQIKVNRLVQENAALSDFKGKV